MDMLNDHIRLVQFGYDGDVDKINLLLRLANGTTTSKEPFSLAVPLCGSFKKLGLQSELLF